MDWLPATKYQRKPLVWWKGKTVRLVREVRNHGGGVMRKGSRAVVADKRGGLALAGSGTYTTRVAYAALDVCVSDNS